jgi:hypothetical protein
MAEADVILRFDIVDGKTPDAEKVAKALLAWVDLMKIAGEIVEPGTRMEVGLVGVEDGSDIFKLALRKCEDAAELIRSGASDYPLVSKAAMTLGGLIGGTVLAVTITNALTPDPRIPEDQMEVFRENNRLLEESVELQKQQNRFYGIMHDEPAFKSFEVIRPYDDRVIYAIPREEFAERSGLWGGDESATDPLRTETRTVIWDVVLIKPVLKPEPRRWGFARDGLEFSALMNDQAFLEAIHDKTLPVRMAEGIKMRLEIKYREEWDGTSWLAVPYSHKVSRVLDPLPPSSPTPLFAGTGAP